MTNDSKLGMLAGVLGVIVAAVMFANKPPESQTQPGANAVPTAKETVAAPPPTANTPRAPDANSPELPSTPVARTRKDVDATPASRQSGLDEEP